MEIGRLFESSMAMDDAAWARHANPWSVWTRVPILPLLALSLYSRAYIGWWCLLPVAALAVWTFVNPRAFPPPSRYDTWAAKATLGERVWLARSERPIPAHHAKAVRVLSVVMAAGVAALAYGLVVLDPWATVAGTVATLGGKLWFCDRMVWLYDEAGDGRFTNQP